VGELARELLAIAVEGLRRQGALDGQGRDERTYLDPMVEQVERDRTAADEILALWHGPWERRVAPLVAACALQA
jgi:glutamate--cysteine ligase